MNKTHYTIREFFDKFPELANIRGVVSTRLRNLAYYGFIEKKAIKDTTPKSKWEYKKEDIITAIRHYCPDFLTATPAKPKYDPCRKFRKGDKVRIVKWNGRIPLCLDDCIGSEYTVSLDEGINGFVHIEGEIEIIHVAHLELITPVEESDLYYIVDSPHAFSICKHGGSIFVATFYKDQPHAREHAKKYCADLNAEIERRYSQE